MRLNITIDVDSRYCASDFGVCPCLKSDYNFNPTCKLFKSELVEEPSGQTTTGWPTVRQVRCAECLKQTEKPVDESEGTV